MSGPFVHDVGAAEFETRVIQRSHTVPVLVDFWAAWCGPCRTLGPVLEKLADEFAGAFELAKIDTETNQEIAVKFGIRGIPAVKLFIDGAIADEFVGALPEPAVREFLEKAIPSAADALVAEAASLAADQSDRARELLTQALGAEPKHSAAHLGMARLCLVDGDADAVREHLAAIGAATDEADDAGYLRQALDLMVQCQNNGGEDACRQRLSTDPDDLDARYVLGTCLVARGQYREALDEFLAVVAKDKRHRDEAARKAMLTVFGIVGTRSELSDSYRDKLSLLI